MVEPLTLALALGALTMLILSIPFVISAIDYRRRDNGLAYMLLVTGVAVWNGMLFTQLLSPDPWIQVYFHSLSVVGAVLSGLGFFLFATTASSTGDYLSRRGLYGAVGIFGGLDIVFAVTAPVHGFYWSMVGRDTGIVGFAVINPELGYWFHTVLLGSLFGAGAALFLNAWLDQPADRYRLAYVIAGTATATSIVLSNVAAPGGFGVASLAAGSLTSIGWLQASRGRPLAWIRAVTG